MKYCRQKNNHPETEEQNKRKSIGMRGRMLLLSILLAVSSVSMPYAAVSVYAEEAGSTSGSVSGSSEDETSTVSGNTDSGNSIDSGDTSAADADTETTISADRGESMTRDETKTAADGESNAVVGNDGGNSAAEGNTAADSTVESVVSNEAAKDAAGTIAGSGTEADPYLVSSWEELKTAAEEAESETTTFIKLSADCKNTNENEKSAAIAVTGTVQIDLNGHTIDRNCANAEAAVEGGSVFRVEGASEEKPASLTVTDSTVSESDDSDDADDLAGKITGGYTTTAGGGIYVGQYGSFNLKQGVIEGNKASTYGGGIYSLGGDVTIQGKVTGNCVETDEIETAHGAGIYMDFSDSVEKGVLTIDRKEDSEDEPVAENYSVLSSDSGQKKEDNFAEREADTPDPDEPDDPEPTVTPTVTPTATPTPTVSPGEDDPETTKGTIRLSAVSNAEGYTWALTTKQKSALAAKVLTTEEKTRIKAGESASLKLELNDVTDTVDGAVKTALSGSLSSKYKTAAYLEVVMTKKLTNDSEYTRVTDLGSAVSLTIGIPSSLSDDDSITAFYIRRQGESKVVTVAAEADADAGTLTYNTKQLSVSALISQVKSSANNANGNTDADNGGDADNDPDQDDSDDSDSKAKITFSAVSNAEGYSWQLTSAEKSKLAGSALTSEEKARYKAGESVDFKLELNDITGTIDSATKSTLTDSLSSKYKAAAYLEVVLYKKLSGDSDYTRVTELGKTVSLTIGVPDSLSDNASSRSYYIRRPDGSDTKTVKASYASDGNTLSFNTKQLSVIAVIYSDSSSDSSGSGSSGSGSSTSGSSGGGRSSGSKTTGKSSTSAAKTGDTSHSMVWTAVLLGAAILLSAALYKKKK